MKKLLFGIVLAVLMLGTVAATEMNKTWDVPSGWYGYPVLSTVEYGGDLLLFTQTTSGIQCWNYDGSTWQINNNSIGDRALSNPIEYKSKVYISVVVNDTSMIVRYDSHGWVELNETYGWDATQLITNDNLMHALTNETLQVKEYSGVVWNDAAWCVNFTDRIDCLSSLNSVLYVLTDTQRFYKVLHSGTLSEFTLPEFGVFPRPVVEEGDLLLCANDNQIFAFNGVNFTLLKVLDPIYHVVTAASDSTTLYLGTQNLMGDNETAIEIVDGQYVETLIRGYNVNCIAIYGGHVYAGTNLGLFVLTETTEQSTSNLTYVEWASFVLGLILVLYAIFTWSEGLEDVILVSGGFAFWSIAILTLFYPVWLLTYVGLIVPVVVFSVFVPLLNYALDTQWDWRYQDKDIRVIAIVLLIVIAIEIGFHLFSKALGL